MQTNQTWHNYNFVRAHKIRQIMLNLSLILLVFMESLVLIDNQQFSLSCDFNYYSIFSSSLLLSQDLFRIVKLYELKKGFVEAPIRLQIFVVLQFLTRVTAFICNISTWSQFSYYCFWLVWYFLKISSQCNCWFLKTANFFA